MFKYYYVYIVASKKDGVLYVGVTNDLKKRVYEHRNKVVEGFTKKYNVSKLVHYEQYESIDDAINREKQIKHWNRSWKIGLIEKENRSWNDLYERI